MGKYFISVVIPVYNEGRQIEHNIGEIRKILESQDIRYELILVDDGSRDDTWQRLVRLSMEYPSIRCIRLSRNFGKEAALCAGLEDAGGDACITMDSDLQHPPELIPEMLSLWQREGWDIIEAVKASRGREHLTNKLGAGLFYTLLERLSGFNLKGSCDFKLMNARVLAAWRKMDERITFFRGMSAWVGFKRKSIPFTVAERRGGGSKWSFFSLVKLAVRAITSFSSLPLQVVSLLGMILLAGSVILGLQTLYMKFKGIAVSGFTTVILLQLIIGSSLMISLGIIGTYIARIYDEVKRRPRYIIAEKTGREAL